MTVPFWPDKVIGPDGVRLPALLTVIATVALVAVCPAALLATAVSKWLPLESVVVSRDTLKSAVVTAAPALLPST